MSNNFYDFLLFISAFILGGLAFVNELKDKGIGKFLRKLSIKFLIIILALIIGFIGTRGKEKNAQTETSNAEKNRDDANRKFNDSSNAKLKLQLAEYGFTLNAQKNEIISFVRDSAKHTNVNIVKYEPPELDVSGIDLLEKKKDTVKLYINLQCRKSKVENLYLRFYTCVKVFDRYLLLPDNKTNEINNQSIITDDHDKVGYTIYGAAANTSNVFYFLILGHYSDSNNKIYPVKILCFFNVTTNTYENPLYPLDSELYSFYKSVGVRFN